jgi:hypothetical protein
MIVTIYQLHSMSRLLVLLASGWEFAGSDFRYPGHIWLMREG